MRCAGTGSRCWSARTGSAPDGPRLENSLDALEASIALGVDYVEFDVQRCDDGSFVVAHDAGSRSATTTSRSPR